jgi:hypothetical protein
MFLCGCEAVKRANGQDALAIAAFRRDHETAWRSAAAEHPGRPPWANAHVATLFSADIAGRIPHCETACDEIQFCATAFCNYCKIHSLRHDPQ